MNVIVDGDIIAYLCAFRDTEGDVLNLRDSVASKVLEWASCCGDDANIVVAMSSGVSFRYWLYRDYKARRKERPAPSLLRDAFDILKEEFEVRLLKGLEGDDVIGIMGTDPEAEAVMVTTDKDLSQVPGRHYNPSKPERGIWTTDQKQADLVFHAQWLSGDPGDDVPGIPGIGPKRAAAILVKAVDEVGSSDPDVLRRAVIRAYDEHGLTDLYCHQMETCIRILRWQDVPPHLVKIFRL